MASLIPFHFVLLSIGEVLKTQKCATAERVQHYLANDIHGFGLTIPLDECRLALKLMADSGFISLISEDSYERVVTNANSSGEQV